MKTIGTRLARATLSWSALTIAAQHGESARRSTNAAGRGATIVIGSLLPLGGRGSVREVYAESTAGGTRRDGLWSSRHEVASTADGGSPRPNDVSRHPCSMPGRAIGRPTGAGGETCLTTPR